MKPLHLIALTVLSLAVFSATAQVAEAGPDTSLCVNFYTMQGSPLPPGATGQWTVVVGCGYSTDPNDPVQLAINLCVGTSVWVWTVDDGGTITSDFVEITVYDASMAVANAGQDQTIVAPQSSAYLSGTPTPIYPGTCYWTIVAGSGNIVAISDPNTMVTGLSFGDNTYRWTCDNGPCGVTSDTITIQMMLATGLYNETSITPALAFDPSTRQLLLLNGASWDALEVFDIHGRTVLRVGAGVRTISMADRPDGVYVVRAVVDGGVQVIRFVVGY